MLTIRDEQFEILRQLGFKEFEDKMLAHIQEYFPEEYESMGEKVARDFIKLGIKKAETYQIKTQRSVCKFIDIMITAGEDFDEADRYRWAREILDGSDNAEVKVDSIVQKILES
jgi:hypothetical protein